MVGLGTRVTQKRCWFLNCGGGVVGQETCTTGLNLGEKVFVQERQRVPWAVYGSTFAGEGDFEVQEHWRQQEVHQTVELDEQTHGEVKGGDFSQNVHGQRGSVCEEAEGEQCGGVCEPGLEENGHDFVRMELQDLLKFHGRSAGHRNYRG